MYSPKSALWIIYLIFTTTPWEQFYCWPYCRDGELRYREIREFAQDHPANPSSDSSSVILAPLSLSQSLPLLHTYTLASTPAKSSVIVFPLLGQPLLPFFPCGLQGGIAVTCLHPLLLDEYMVCPLATDDCTSVGHLN